MARETLKDFLTQRGSTEDSISITLKGAPDGIGIEPGTGEELLDLLNDTKGMLGDYLKYLVDDSSNHFKIKGGNGLANSSQKGDALQIADSMGAENIHVEQGTELKSKLNENSNSNKFDNSGTPLSDLIDKVGNDFSNHEKLKEIVGRPLNKTGKTLVSPTGEQNDIVQATQKMFLKNNRFANVGSDTKTSFSEKPQLISDFERSDKTHNKGTMVSQSKFGEYDQDEGIVSIDELKKLGASLLFKASGFDPGLSPTNSGNIEDVAESISSLNQGNNLSKDAGFKKIEFEKTRSKHAKGFPVNSSGESIRSGRGDAIEMDGDSNSSSTFGSTYNDTFRFFGKSIKLHKIQAAITLIALKKISTDFFGSFMNSLRESDRIDLATGAEEYLQENSKVDIGVYMLGQSRKLSSIKINHHIFSNILTNTTFPFGDAVDKGLEIILGPDKDSNDEKKIIKNKVLAESPGYWLSVARSVLKSFDTITSKYLDSLSEPLTTDDLFLIYKEIIDTNKFIQFFNVMAIIGDISLQSTGGVKNTKNDFKHPRDVDAFPDNRAVHKSRKKAGLNKNELSWNQDATPSMYILPANIIRAASRLNNTVYGESPVRGMFGSKIVKNTYTGVDVDGSYNRIPNEVVKVLEDQLDAEYVPFYIQDLRTNEIISFNAFLDTLTDSITPTYNPVDGYGRMDPVQIYKSTKRSLSVSFTLVATNREDFDSMWYKINKLVTLLYPQWTPGTMVSNDKTMMTNSKFYMPFSQVIGASPIVRLRIGDVIKSNYSRFALARTFGIGDSNVTTLPQAGNEFGGSLSSLADAAKTHAYNTFTDIALKIWLAIVGSPHSVATALFNASGGGNSNAAKILNKSMRSSTIQALSNMLVNGFANPLAVNDIVKQLRDPNVDNSVTGLASPISQFKRNINNSTHGAGISDGYYTALESSNFGLRQMFLKPNVINGYYCEETGKKYLVPRRLKVRVIDKKAGLAGLPPQTIGYKVKVIDPNSPKELGSLGEEKHLIVMHSDILPDPKELFTNSIVGATLFATDPTGIIDSLVEVASDTTQSAGLPNEITDYIRSLYSRQESLFMRPSLNPFVRAIETTKGRGLAGVMGAINFNWLDDTFAWETDFNARAPMGCKISFSFEVIHDIPPGLDHSGYNKAPLYNVGEIMKNISGDVYTDDGKQAEFNYRQEGGYATRVKGEDNK